MVIGQIFLLTLVTCDLVATQSLPVHISRMQLKNVMTDSVVRP
jgi:hypothetical protein